MDILIKQLVELLIVDSPIYFTERDKINKENYFYFQPMGDAEAAAIRHGNHDEQCKYDQTGSGLHFPDISAIEYIQLEEKRNPIALESMISRISQLIPVFVVEYPILVATFSVLHEYGHWIHYTNSGKSPYEYAQMELEERKPHQQIVQRLCRMDDGNPLKIMMVRKYHNEIYLRYASERFADEYAMEHFEGAINKVRIAMNYSEEDFLGTPVWGC